MGNYITIFTPTYNRAYRLKNLYESLISQTNNDFVWLVVDDGSTDNTKELIESFINDNILDIVYIFQKNVGKHVAINKGVSVSSSELFFIVDSDDELPHDSISTIIDKYETIKDNPKIGCISGTRIDSTGSRIGGKLNLDTSICNYLDLRYKFNVVGDLSEVYRTKVLKEFPFPVFSQEKFCPEALVWNRIAQKYDMLFFDKALCVCEYLPDGLSAKITKLRMNSPQSSMMYYSELSELPIPLKSKLKACVNYWRFAFCFENPFVCKDNLFLMPLGLIYHIIDRKRK